MTVTQARRRLGLALLVYGSVGIIVMLRLVPLVVQAFGAWLGGNPAAMRPTIPIFDILETHYDARPWLAWVAWLIALLLIAPKPADDIIDPPLPEAIAQQNSKLKTQNSKLLIPLILLVLILGVGAYTRLNLLVPQERGLIEYPYDDEGVYAEASQLSLQGIIPYRDYFFAHPPVASLVYIPAFAYHYTAWGSPTSFILGRYLSVAYSLLTAIALFFLGRRAAQDMDIGWLSADNVGAVAALLWAVDGQVVEINRKVMLDQPMVLFSSLTLLCYLQAMPRREVHTPAERRWLIIAGVFAALAALTKIAGLAAGLAIFTHALATALERRIPTPQLALPQAARENGEPSPPLPIEGSDALQVKSKTHNSKLITHNSKLRTRWFTLGWTALGFVVAALLIVLPYAVLAGGQMIREVFFFQLLRPGDGVASVAERLPLIAGATLGAITTNPLTLACAAFGCLLLGWRIMRGTRLGGWSPIILWTIFSFALFTYTRSFYTHYYIQLAAPLCLLGGAVALWPQHRSRSFPTFFYPAASALVLLILLPMLGYQWSSTTKPRPDPMYRDVAKYVTDAVKPDTPVLTLDDQFNFLAARPPSFSPSSGYLVDSYGHMIYLGLNIGGRDFGQLLNGVLHDPRTDDPYAAMWQDAPQADMLQRIAASPLVVVHDVGAGRLRQDTLDNLGQTMKQQTDASTTRYQIYRK